MQGYVPRVLWVPPMIARRLWTNNGFGQVVHRFHKRESCVFHSIHRFGGIFPSWWNEALTCDDSEMERVFDGEQLE
jgi:hypothetical protein